MRSRPTFWLLISLLCFAGAVVMWRVGERWAGRGGSKSSLGDLGTGGSSSTVSGVKRQRQSASATASWVVSGSSAPGFLTGGLPSDGQAAAAARAERLGQRLRNTDKTVGELLGDERGILLENALIDTRRPLSFSVPDALRSVVDPGSYVVQARGVVDEQFREALRGVGAEVVSAIPNHAYLVRVNAAGAERLQSRPEVAAVLGWVPAYKILSGLLPVALKGQELPAGTLLNVGGFADARVATLNEFARLGVEVLGEGRSPFGPVWTVRAPADWVGLARLPGVMVVEKHQARVSANDLSRARVGVAVNSVAPDNYLNLTGSNVLVNVNDTAVDATHPDLVNRVIGDFPASLLDTNGHGTHVAGIIAGDGAQSTTVSNASGSVLPAVAGQFRGKAPGARIFAMRVGLGGGGFSDAYLQETASRTNAFISNNSWHNGADNTYSLSAASFDAAVRDAQPEVTGSQPMLYVFAAGNGGDGDDAGLSGNAESIGSPGTLKNGITVGALEQPRDITNEVWKCTGIGTNAVNCQTNEPWRGMTSSAFEVAAFSARGNVGIGVEGEFGRFKPDVVAPGTFVVSTRSTQWDEGAYYSPTNHQINSFEKQVVPPGGLNTYSLLVPANAVGVTITAVAAGIDLPMYLKATDVPTTNDFVRDNQLFIPADLPLAAVLGSVIYFGVGNTTTQAVNFTVFTDIITTNDNGNYFQVLSNLNSQLGPHYRYESGTSQAAADVSGVLALMQEFFQTRGITNSPALYKALLINGARSVGTVYDFQVNNTINYQGWGLVNLPTSLPEVITNGLTHAVPSSIQAYDQSPTNALATGQWQARQLTVSENARLLPLRVTLVWTDPPGNPAAGVKLVNNLDLVVTNLETGDVYFGNDIPTASYFTAPWISNTPPNVDLVNNVENVYLPPPLGSNYAVAVFGRYVNVNAVTAHTNDVAQDYALVISSGNGELPDALTVTETPLAGTNQWTVTPITNSFTGNPELSGGLLLGQHVGANTPLLGTTNGLLNQWHFYVITNTTGFTNAAFVTFLPPTLSLPRMGVYERDLDNATRLEADIDLYVSLNPALTNLDPNVIASCAANLGNDQSARTRGGTELVIYSNAVLDQVYYIGVKSEDYMAAEYAFLGVFSLNPFSSEEDGVVTVHGFPVPAIIPDGSPAQPGGVFLLGLAVQQVEIRRVVATNAFFHENPGDLLGNLTHGRQFAVLNNHRGALPGSYGFVYEDNGEDPLQHTDGPGSLRSFVGEQGFGVWILAMVDNALTHTGRVERVGDYDGFSLRLEPQNLDNSGAIRAVQPNTFTYDFINVPINATNLIVCVSGNTGPMELYVRRGDFPTRTLYDYTMTVPVPGGCLTIDKSDLPPLTAGRYYLGVYNSSGVVQNIRLLATLGLDLAAIATVDFTSGGNQPLLDDAVSYSSIFINDRARIASVDVGVALNHPRISDLALTLISPSGTRVLLMENRGGTNAATAGTGAMTTNVTTVATSFETVLTNTYVPGYVLENWTVTNNIVTVVSGPGLAMDGQNSLALRAGGIARNFVTQPNASYTLTYAYRQVPTMEGIVSWWPGENTANDIVDGNNGTVRNGASFIVGEVGQTFNFNGVDQYVELANSSNLNPAGSFSIEGWLFPQRDGGQAILAKWGDAGDQNGNRSYIFHTLPGQGLRFAISDAVNQANVPFHNFDTPNNVLTLNAWNHVAAVYNQTSGTRQIFVNGLLTAQRTDGPITVLNGVSRVGIGATLPSGTTSRDFLQGSIDELAVYSRGLLASEIQSIYAAGAAGKCGLVFPPANCLSLLGGQLTVEGLTTNTFTALSTNWVTNSINFTTTQAVTQVQFGSAGGNSGILLDGISLTESLVATQNFHLTFTENTNFTTTPIKFASWPLATGGGSSTNYFISGFETAIAGEYLSPATVDGWSVLTSQVSQVSVVGDPALAASGSNLLALAKGRISRTLPTVSGRHYTLSHRYRGPGIVSWWRGEDNTLDQITGNTGILVQGATYANARVARGFSFDGVNDSVHVPDSPSLKLTNSLTMEAWMFITNRPTRPGVVIFRGDSRGGFDPYLLITDTAGPSGTVGIGICNTAGTSTGFGIPLPINQYVHIVGTLEDASGSLRMYTNGVLAGQMTTTIRPLGDLNPGSAPGVGIGNHSGNPPNVFNYPLRGKLDEVSLYNRAITASEVRAIWAAGSAGKFNPSLPVPQNLAEARVTSGNLAPQIILGNNTTWQTNAISFTATQNGTPLEIEGLQPGVLLDTFTLTESGGGAQYFLPEESLKALADENVFGEWRLELWDSRTGMTNLVSLVDWQLQFVYQTDVPFPGTLVHAVPKTNTIPPGQIAYYVVDVPAWAQYATNTLIFASGNVNVFFNQNTPPTGTNAGDFTLIGPATSGSATLSLATAPPLVPGERYYLGIQNPGATPVTFGIRVDFDILPLTNTVPVSSTLALGTLPRYFSYDVSTNATAVTFSLTNLSGNVDLIARKGAPLPTLTSFDHGSFNGGNNDEEILLLTNSQPVALSPGQWYLGVFNQDFFSVTYTIVAVEYTNAPFPDIITLENGIPYDNTNNVVPFASDYYRYVVTNPVARAQFEINNPSADLTLVARKGLLPPDLTTYDYLSANTNLNDELIVLFKSSTPVPLSVGSWYLTAVNVSGVPATYSIKATQWPLTGRPLIITSQSVVSNSFCLTWTSLPGVHYYVEGVTNLASTTTNYWHTLSPTITAIDYQTSWCLPLPSPFHYFRVVEGIAPKLYEPPWVFTRIVWTNNAVLLEWTGPANRSNLVQWSPNLVPPAWNTFTNIFTSTNGQFQFVDDGSQTSGLTAPRFYRLLQL